MARQFIPRSHLNIIDGGNRDNTSHGTGLAPLGHICILVSFFPSFSDEREPKRRKYFVLEARKRFLLRKIQTLYP